MKAQNLAKKINPTLKSYGVKKAALFGSHARKSTQPNSDLDIVVELGKKISLLDFVGLNLELEKQVNKKVDLVQYKTLKPSLKKYILKDQIIFYRS